MKRIRKLGGGGDNYTTINDLQEQNTLIIHEAESRDSLENKGAAIERRKQYTTGNPEKNSEVEKVSSTQINLKKTTVLTQGSPTWMPQPHQHPNWHPPAFS